MQTHNKARGAAEKREDCQVVGHSFKHDAQHGAPDTLSLAPSNDSDSCSPAVLECRLLQHVYTHIHTCAHIRKHYSNAHSLAFTGSLYKGVEVGYGRLESQGRRHGTKCTVTPKDFEPTAMVVWISGPLLKTISCSYQTQPQQRAQLCPASTAS